MARFLEGLSLGASGKDLKDTITAYFKVGKSNPSHQQQKRKLIDVKGKKRESSLPPEYQAPEPVKSLVASSTSESQTTAEQPKTRSKSKSPESSTASIPASPALELPSTSSSSDTHPAPSSSQHDAKTSHISRRTNKTSTPVNVPLPFPAKEASSASPRLLSEARLDTPLPVMPLDKVCTSCCVASVFKVVMTMCVGKLVVVAIRSHLHCVFFSSSVLPTASWRAT